jgi:hypothetical protein
MVKLASTQWNLINKKKNLGRFYTCDMFLSAVSILVVVQLSSEVLEGLMNYPVYIGFRWVKLLALMSTSFTSEDGAPGTRWIGDLVNTSLPY